MPLGETLKEWYRIIFKENYSPVVGGILLALLVILLEMWYCPWGIVGGLRNWGEWVLYGVGLLEEAPSHPLWFYSSVLNIGLVLGAFISACLAQEFGIKIPSLLEIIKAVVGGILMGVGSAFAFGCNIEGFYMAIANLSASGITMLLGLMIGIFLGIKYFFWEKERFAFKYERIIDTRKISPFFVIIALLIFLWGSYVYLRTENKDGQFLLGLLLISTAIGFVIHRMRFCMVNIFKEPLFSGDITMAKKFASSLFLVSCGLLFIKMMDLKDPLANVYPTFFQGSLIGGIIFGFGMMLAGGCAVGVLWRMAEGEIKQLIVVFFFALTYTVFRYYFDYVWKVWDKGVLGVSIFLPNLFGYVGSFIIISIIIFLWYGFIFYRLKAKRIYWR
jgi:uncharacterized membrane protein YedE/YeeE